jgi:hypothetical protein
MEISCWKFSFLDQYTMYFRKYLKNIYDIFDFVWPNRRKIITLLNNKYIPLVFGVVIGQPYKQKPFL